MSPQACCTQNTTDRLSRCWMDAPRLLPVISLAGSSQRHARVMHMHTACMRLDCCGDAVLQWLHRTLGQGAHLLSSFTPCGTLVAMQRTGSWWRGMLLAAQTRGRRVGSVLREARERVSVDCILDARQSIYSLLPSERGSCRWRVRLRALELARNRLPNCY